MRNRFFSQRHILGRDAATPVRSSRSFLRWYVSLRQLPLPSPDDARSLKFQDPAQESFYSGRTGVGTFRAFRALTIRTYYGEGVWLAATHPFEKPVAIRFVQSGPGDNQVKPELVQEKERLFQIACCPNLGYVGGDNVTNAGGVI